MEKPTGQRRRWLIALAILCVPLAGFAHAQPLDDQAPLRWGADCNGGIPYVLKDPEGKPRLDEPDGPVTGFEADLRDALERELNVRIIFQQLKFDNIYADLDQSKCDFALNGLEITAENKARADFTRPYYRYQQQLVVRADEKEFATLEECRERGHNVGTLSGCTAVRVLEQLKFSDAQIKTYDDQDGPYQDLSLKRNVRAVLLDLPAAIYYAAPDPQLKFGRSFPGLKFAGAPFAPGYYGIAVKKGNEALRGRLDAAVVRILQSGELKRILLKWELWNPDQYELYSDIRVAGSAPTPWTFGRYFPLLLDGAAMTVFLTVASMALAVVLGLLLALARLYGPAPVRWLAIGYVEFFRGIPVLLLLYFLYYGLGYFAAHYELDFLKLQGWQAAILGFGMNYAAYEAEIYRAGISSIPIGQWEAAASLGMPAPLAFRRIILPQAIRVILPPMTNDFVALFKDTSVVAIIAVTELSAQYQMLTKSGGGYVEIGLTTAALYLIMSVPLGHLSRYLEKRWGAK